MNVSRYYLLFFYAILSISTTCLYGNQTFPIRVTAHPQTGRCWINITPGNNADKYFIITIDSMFEWQAYPFLRAWWTKNARNLQAGKSQYCCNHPSHTNTSKNIHGENIEIDKLITIMPWDRDTNSYYGSGASMQSTRIRLLDRPISKLFVYLKRHKRSVIDWAYMITVFGCICVCIDAVSYIKSKLS